MSVHRPPPGRPKLLATLLATLTLTGAIVLAGLAPALAQGTAPGPRLQAVLGRLRPTPDAYLERGALKPIQTMETDASIPGLAVRQQPLNAGLFDTGCAQCHRLSGPLPPASGAPADLFDGLGAPAAAAGPAPAGFHRVTDATERDDVPSWSPDGSRLLFERRGEDGTWSLMLVDAAGGEPRALTSGSDAGWADWSPDGSRIVFWGVDDAGRGNLWLVGAAGGEPARVTDAEATAFPVWSPDGSRIAYQEKLPNGAWSLELLDPDTLEAQPITPPVQTMPSRPQFSPDGAAIAYQVAVHGDFGLWRLEFPRSSTGAVDYGATPVSVPGSTLLPMDIGQAHGNSTWSPDGTRIALQMVNLVTAPNGEPLLSYKTWLTAPNGASPQLLLPGRTLADRSPSWSPTGSWLVQWSWNDDLRAAVWLVSADGATAVDLTADLGGDALYPSWSPDGTRVAFTSDREGTFDVWVADLTALVPDFRP